MMLRRCLPTHRLYGCRRSAVLGPRGRGRRAAGQGPQRSSDVAGDAPRRVAAAYRLGGWHCQSVGPMTKRTRGACHARSVGGHLGISPQLFCAAYLSKHALVFSPFFCMHAHASSASKRGAPLPLAWQGRAGTCPLRCGQSLSADDGTRSVANQQVSLWRRGPTARTCNTIHNVPSFSNSTAAQLP